MAEEKDRGGVTPQRSPSYPGYGLRRAIDMVTKAYKGAHRSEMGNEVLAELIGFQMLSGPALAAISTLKQFGLIDGRDPKLRVTKLALEVLEPIDDDDRRVGLAKIAVTPPLYADLFKEFSGKVPAESVIRAIAIRRYGFSSAGAARFVSGLKDTINYLQEQGVEIPDAENKYNENQHSESSAVDLSTIHTDVAVENRHEPIGFDGERVEFRLSPTSRAVILFSGRVTRQGIEKLSSILALVKDAYPDGEDT